MAILSVAARTRRAPAGVRGSLRAAVLLLLVAALLVQGAAIASADSLGAPTPLTWALQGSHGAGDPNNTTSWSSALFGGLSFFGSENVVTGAELWAAGPTTPPFQANADGFGEAGNTCIGGLVAFNGYLYAGTRNDYYGAQIWRSANGVSWSKVVTGGFGSVANIFVPQMCVFGGTLYADTWNPVTGVEVWRTTDGTNWQQCNPDGFGTAANIFGWDMTVFGGKLYVSTQNMVTGGEVWTFDGYSWSAAKTGGFGHADNIAVTGLTVDGPNLYAGTMSGAIPSLSTGAEIWKTTDGSNWTAVTTGGFGDASNFMAGRGAVYDGTLFWGFSSSAGGARVYATADRSVWHQVNIDGFGNVANEGTVALLPMSDPSGDPVMLVAGTANHSQGSELWGLADGTLPPEPVEPATLEYDPQPWAPEPCGMTRPGDGAAFASATFAGKYLVAAENQSTGVEIWAKSPSGAWSMACAPGFGDSQNMGMEVMQVYDGRLYAAPIGYGHAPQLWTTSDGADWSLLEGTPWSEGDSSIFAMCSFGGQLYACVGSSVAGYGYTTEVWRYDGSSWTQVLDGVSFGKAGYSIGYLCEFKGMLYAQAEAPGRSGTEIWRSANGSDWTVASPGGLGDPDNMARGLVSFEGYLYATTADSSNTGFDLRRSADGVSWEAVTTNGFGNADNFGARPMCVTSDGWLYLTVRNDATGGKVIRTTDGIHWSQVNQNGFGSAATWAAGAGAEFAGTVYAIGYNESTGVQVWRMGADTDAPVTTALADPATPGSDGWHRTPVTVTLTADEPGTTEYRWDLEAGPWTAYVSPIHVPNGAHKLYFRSTDRAGNVEAPRQLDVKVNTLAGSVLAPDLQRWRLAAHGRPSYPNGSRTESIEFQGNLLFVTGDDVNGCSVWRIAPGGAPERVTPVSASFKWVQDLAQFDSKLFAGTSDGLQWSFDGASWSKIAGAPKYSQNLCSFGGYLYTTGYDPATPDTGPVGDVGLWRSADGTTWERVQATDPVTWDIWNDMVVFDGELYATACNSAGGSQVWRSANGVDWVPSSAPGFNTGAYIGRLFVLGDRLYASMSGPDGSGGYTASWYRTDGAGVWEAVNLDGFGDPQDSTWTFSGGIRYAGADYITTFGQTGLRIMRSKDGGATWAQVCERGFGDPGDAGPNTMALFDGKLWVSADSNPTGWELWTLGGPPSDDVTPPTTSVTLDPAAPQGSGGWFTTNPVVTLSADEPATIDYWWDDAAARDRKGYDGPFTAPPGTHTLHYRSTDTVGNRESVKSVSVKVDTSILPPDPQSWRQVATDAFGTGPGGVGGPLTAVVEFKDRLYVGLQNNTLGSLVFSSGDGRSWSETAPRGFGSPFSTLGVTALIVDGEWLYAGTRTMGGAQIWRTSDGSNWTEFVPAGFGDSANAEISAFAVDGWGRLWAFTANSATGSQAWALGLTNANVWSGAGMNGLGDANNQRVSGAVYCPTDSCIYVATENPQGGQLLKVSAGYAPWASWELAAPPGLGDPTNRMLRGPGLHGASEVWVGTVNDDGTGGQLWKVVSSLPAGSAEVLPGYPYVRLVTRNGFVDASNEGVGPGADYDGAIYVGTRNGSSGGRVFRSTDDGGHWAKVSTEGFGDPTNIGVSTLISFKGELYAVATNLDKGAQVWVLGGPAPDTTPPVTTPVATPAVPDGDDGWYKTLPAGAFSVDEPATTNVRVEYAPGMWTDWQTYLGPQQWPGDGVFTVEYYSVDTAGNREATKSFELRVDTTAPARIEGATVTNVTADSITVSWPASSDSPSGIRDYRLGATTDGQSVWTAGPSTSLTIGGLVADTSYDVQVTARDNAGNVSAASDAIPVRTLGGEPTPPITTPILDPPTPDGPDGWYTTPPMITLTANEPGTTQYQWDGTAADGWQVYMGAFPALLGEHTLHFRSVDVDGNAETTKDLTIKAGAVPAVLSQDLKTWGQDVADGFGHPGSWSTFEAVTLAGRLFVGSGTPDGDGDVWSKTVGGHWQSTSFPGGNPYVLAASAGRLYVSAGNGCWSTSDGSSWTQVAGPEMPDTPGWFSAMREFDGNLYASGYNQSGQGLDVWRFDGTSWSRVAQGVGGTDVSSADALEVFQGRLYLAMYVWPGGERICSTADGADWTAVPRPPRVSGVNGLLEHAGSLYIGGSGSDGTAQIWRSPNGADWTPVLTGDFGDPANNRIRPALSAPDGYLYCALPRDARGGGQIWRTLDGTVWESVCANGFGDDANFGAPAMAWFDGTVYAATRNDTGGTQVWYLGGQGPSAAVSFADPMLEQAVRDALGKPLGDITETDMLSLTDLQASFRGITDLSGLQYARNLGVLSIGDNQVTDLSPLAGLTSLTMLDARYCQISDLTPLSGMTGLGALMLDRDPINDLSALRGVTGLMTLTFSETSVSDLSPLSGLTNLTWLQGDRCQISDLSPLAGLTGLNSLWMDHDQISDVTPLSGLVGLQFLGLGDNRITDLTALSGLQQVVMLDLYDNRISDLTPLAGLTRVWELWLSNNRISDLTPLAGLTRMTSLHLDGNQVSDVTPLSGMTTLRELSMSNNEVSDLSPVRSMTGLSSIGFANNQVSDLSPLTELTGLTAVSMGGNLVTDISPLVANAGLGNGAGVWMQNNYVDLTSGSGGKTGIDALVSRGVYVAYSPQKTLPTSTLGITPAQPDGSGGWYTTIPAIVMAGSATDGFYYAWDSPDGDFTKWSGDELRPSIGVHTLYYYAANSDGFKSPVASAEFKVDVTAPVTTPNALPASPDGLNGWYKTLPQAWFTTDEPATTYFRVEYAPGSWTDWMTFLGPQPWPGDGIVTVEYYSVDAAGNREATKSLTVKVDTTAPAKVTGLRASDVTTDSVTISWDPSTDALSGVRGYGLQQLSPGAPSIISTGPTTSRVLTGLQPDTTYTFDVRARDMADNVSDPSDSITVKTAKVDPIVTFADAKLEQAVSDVLGKPVGAITEGDMLGLTELTAYGQGITSLDGLEYASNLTRLTVGGNQISDITPLAGLTKLTWLLLPFNQISDITPLAGLTQLHDLYLQYNQISDITSLRGLPELYFMSLSNNPIDDLTPLAGHTTIAGLYCENMPLSDLTPLSGCTGLQGLYLSGDSITDVRPLQGLTSLSSLALDTNQIGDISPLAGLTGLTDFSCSFNKITDITPMEGMTKLKYTTIRYNKVTDLSALLTIRAAGGLQGGWIDTSHNYLDLTPGSDDMNAITLLSSASPMQYTPQNDFPVASVSAAPAAPDGAAGWYKTAPTVSIGGQASDGFYFKWDSSAGDFTKYANAIAVPSGIHTLYTYAANNDGFRCQVGSTIFKVDAQAPTVAISSPAGGTLQSSANMAVAGTAADAGASGLSRVEISVDGGAWQTAAGTDAWSVQLATPTGPGTHTVRARSVDGAGNASPLASVDFLVDVTAPVTMPNATPATPDGDAGWFKTDPTVWFTTDEPATTHYRLKEASGAWSDWMTFTAAQVWPVDGDFTVEYYSVDALHNTEAVKSLTVKVDTTAPAKATGLASSNVTTSSATISWNAGTDAVSGVRDYDLVRTCDGQPTVVTPGSTASQALTGLAPDTTYTFQVRVRDNAGNVSALCDPITVKTAKNDTTAPTTSIQCGHLGAWTNVSPVTFTLTAADDAGGVGVARTYYQIGSDPATAYAGTVSVSAEGTTTVRYWSVDAAGNVETAHTAQILIDAHAPSLTGRATTQPNAAGWYTGPISVHFSATDALSGVAVVSGDVTLGTDGAAQTASGSATDVAGNRATASVSGINIDTKAPSTSCDATSVYVGSATVNLSATDAVSGVAKTYYSFDGGLTKTAGTSVTTSAPGAYTLTFWSVDAAGNAEAAKTASFALYGPASTNVALAANGGAVTAYSAQYGANGLATFAIDGKKTYNTNKTAWMVQNPRATESITLSFSSTRLVSKADLFNDGAWGAKAVAVYTSTDNVNWSKAGSWTGLNVTAGAVRDNVLTFAPVQAKYVRFDVSQPGTSNMLHINETEVYASDPLPAPKVSVTPSSVAFGTVIAGSSSSATVTVTNAGNAPMRLASLTLAPAATGLTMVAPATPQTLAPGASAPVRLTFAPTTEGAFASTLTIVTDDPKTPSVQVGVSGTGALKNVALAANGGAVAAYSAQYATNGLATFAIDGKKTYNTNKTAWMVQNPRATESITLSFASTALISKADFVNDGAYGAKAVSIYCSTDNVNWTLAGTWTGLNVTSGAIRDNWLTFTPVRAKYVRFDVGQPGTKSSLHVCETEVYGVP